MQQASSFKGRLVENHTFYARLLVCFAPVRQADGRLIKSKERQKDKNEGKIEDRQTNRK